MHAHKDQELVLVAGYYGLKLNIFKKQHKFSNCGALQTF
jgi:hypothetical protein